MYLVYTTFPTMQEAETVAQHLVEQKLAACANILPHMHSIYHWQGKLEKTQECLCFFKTTKEGFLPLQEALEAAHSYEVPCIVALPIAEVSQAYGLWLQEHVADCKQKRPL